ncbi:pectate lyase [Allocatelliglobosispora scoriae]|uniref:Pectate lyase n=1 Tax=Allocatelliglobosispora scoriae TaxID=643052 RepID=A0A841C5J1_9ACTN|nr:family 16 glycoside hydrolase [Allocatelliglobosispora scoriae]MBB5874559.1 pectate lyase [Allocatelliglobosispora scoriae]
MRHAWLASGIAAVVTSALLVLTTTAHAATLFNDDFNDGNSTGWSKSGGSWAVVADGSPVFQQTSTGSDAKAQAGSAWGNQSVQARVKPLAFSSGSGRLVGLIGRAQSMTNYYYLALGPGQVLLGKRTGGGYATIASAPASVSTGTWATLRFEAFGGSLRGYLNGALAVSGTDSAFATGKIGLTTYYSGASFDDVVVTDSPGPGPSISPSSPASPSASVSPSASPSAPPSPSPSTSPTPPTPGQADGYASVNAWGQNGTSGGTGGPTVTVSTAAAFLSAIAQPGKLVIQVSGTITLPGPMHDVTSDKTIVGLGAGSGLTGGGLNIGLPIDDAVTAPPANAVRNVIVRNLTIRDCPDDCINVQMFSHHVWIDHNDLSEQFDGALDAKRGSSWITISWNRFHNSDKNMLLGHDDSNGAQDIGRLKVTYHHNFLDGSSQRNPRVRFGEPVHIYNNYYLHITGYGAASQMNACLVVENNYFDDVEKPTRNDVGGSAGRIEARGNINVNTEDPIVTSGSCSGQPGSYYAYSPDSAAAVPALVSAGAGVGKI